MEKDFEITYNCLEGSYEESFTGTDYDLHRRIEQIVNDGGYNIHVMELHFE